MRGSNPDEKILSYNDVVLRRSDLDILSGPHFLNDRIIEFYFSYLSLRYPSRDVLLVPPSISFWIMNCPAIESPGEFVWPLDLAARKMVLFPINDNEDVTAADGGSHWSLVVYRRDADTFFHHDSCRGTNERGARRLHKVVAGFMSGGDAEYVECSDSPQQTNGYDCGLYVTAIARVACQWQQDHDEDRNRDDLRVVVEEEVVPSVVAEMRNDILRLIQGLMAGHEV